MENIENAETAKIDLPEITVDMYSLNKSLYTKATPLSPTKIREGFEKIQRTYNSMKESTYFMLLNNEIRYYTLFHKSPDSVEPFGDVVRECVESFGTIKDVASVGNNSFEIWITNKQNETYCFMLFDYTAGVIEVQA